MKKLLVAAAVMGSMAVAVDYPVEVEQTEMQHTATITVTVKDKEELGAKFAEIYPKIWAFLSQQGIEPSAAPFSRYHKWEPGTAIEVEAGFPVEKPIVGAEGIAASTLPGGKVAVTVHVGPYEKIGEAHEAMHKWMADNHQKQNGAPWEAYVNDPGTVPPEEYRTEIYYPIQ